MSECPLPRFARPGDKATVRLSDNQLRRAEATGYPDTMFSTPARVKIGGRTVYGFVTIGTREDGHEYYRFTPRQ